MWKLEEEFNLLDLKIDKVKVWQNYRFKLYHIFATQTGLAANLLPDIKNKSIRERIINYFELLKNSFFYNPFCCTDMVDEIVIAHPRIKKINGKYIDIYTKYLVDDMEINGVNYCLWEFPYKGKYHTIPSKKTKRLAVVQLIAFFLQKIYLPQISKKELTLINKINKAINNEFQIDIDFLNITKTSIKKFKANYYLYKILFQQWKPKKVYVVSPYGGGFIMKAAKDCGVEIIELQHGVISNYHICYSFPYLASPLEYYPDKFYSWGKFWSELIEFPISNENIIDYGFAHIKATKDNYKNINKEPNTIIVLSQDMLNEYILEFIKSHVKELEKYKIIYKLHPNEVNFMSKNKTLIELSTQSNFEIAGNVDVYELFSRAQFVIGVFSTAIYESLFFHCYPILIDLPGIEYMKKIIEEYNIPVINNNSNIIKSLSQAQKCNINVNDFF